MKNPPALPLESLQVWMQSILVHPIDHDGDHPGARLPAPYHEGTIEALVRPSKRMSARQRLGLYQRSYLLRLRGCMEGQFPALQATLGEALFGDFATAYVQAHPSTSYTLADLGRHFADHLDATRPDRDGPGRESWPDFLIELARLEFTIAQVFDVVVEDEGMADRRAIRPAPTLRLLRHMFPTLRYYRTVLRSPEPPPLPSPGASYAVVVRVAGRIGVFDVDALQFELLSALQDGETFEEALGRVSRDDEALERAGRMWKERWMEDGVLVS